MSDKERMKRLNAAFDAMGAGLSEAELAEMTGAMTGVKTIADVLYDEVVIADLVKRTVRI